MWLPTNSDPVDRLFDVTQILKIQKQRQMVNVQVVSYCLFWVSFCEHIKMNTVQRARLSAVGTVLNRELSYFPVRGQRERRKMISDKPENRVAAPPEDGAFCSSPSPNMSVACVRLFACVHTRVVNMLVDGPRLGAADRKLDCLLGTSLGRAGLILHRGVLSARSVTRRKRAGGRRTACVSVVCVSEKHRHISAISACSSRSCNTFSTSFKSI